jgi:site-specific recombinase XerD
MKRNRCLTNEEESKLRRAMRRRGDLLGRRDYAWVRLLLTTGMRLKEFSMLTVGDAWAALNLGYLFVPKEHRKKQACDLSVHAKGEVQDALRDLLSVCAEMSGTSSTRLPEGHPLVLSRNGEAMSERAYQQRMKEIAIEAGIDPAVSPHWLRHTFAVTFLENSEGTPQAALVRLKNLLGHTSISSCMEYLTMSREDVGTEIERIFPSRRRVRGAALRKAYEGRVAA